MSSSEPTPTAADGSALPDRAPDFAAPAAYPASPTVPPASPVASGHGTPAVPGMYGPPPGGAATTDAAGWTAPAVPLAWTPPLPPERVGRGLLFSLGGIVVGVVLTVVLWKLNFIASITSFAMAYAAIWLYAKGAGRAPAKGAVGLILVIAAGVAACLASLIVADTFTELAQYPDLRPDVTLQVVVANLLDPGVWEAYTREILMYLLFAALGTFGLLRQLGRARRS